MFTEAKSGECQSCFQQSLPHVKSSKKWVWAANFGWRPGSNTTHKKQVCQNIWWAARREECAVHSKLAARFNWRCCTADYIALALRGLATYQLSSRSGIVRNVRWKTVIPHTLQLNRGERAGLSQHLHVWWHCAWCNMYLQGSPREATRALPPQAERIFQRASAIRWWNKHCWGKTE